MNVVEFAAYLKRHGVETGEWGTGKAKTIAELHEEVEAGEGSLELVSGILTRFVKACAIDVYGDIGSRRMRLVEVKQVFADGRERVRNLQSSLGEKLKPGEQPLDAAKRAMVEELEIHEKLQLVSQPDRSEGPRKTDSYPGLPTVYLFYRFDVHLPDHLVKVGGYAITEEFGTAYYEWR
jgi:hypothetical protein